MQNLNPFTEHEINRIVKTKSNLKVLISYYNLLRNRDVSSITERDNIIFAGGYFVSDLNHEDFNDIDMFILNNRQDLFDYISYKNEIKESDLWTYNMDSKYLKNPHVIATAKNKESKAQVILTDYKSRRELLDHFDMLHCTVSYVPDEDKLYITRGAYDSIISKRMVQNNKNKIADWRIDKYAKRGWGSAIQYLQKIA